METKVERMRALEFANRCGPNNLCEPCAVAVRDALGSE